ncbi:PIG-L family deacetylase [Aciduricibacillus chroicocephali]|uniref:PIG-L family deacetylase n=1 Tax=Aciduricibacillus chroicocephali TaxID=3054939 RepID=A0ABY9KX56_9BACI|nr:PIG-L family deacetylase [Bacillaceae bacterium 44XB]
MAANQLWNALKKLQSSVSFMNIGAHPDDERSDLLAFLSRGLGVRTTAIIANRGEGGQNAIGSEHGNALGVLRTEEMKQAANVLGIETFHLSENADDPIYDHGFEKTAADTLRKWGKDLVYNKLIRLIREHRPDIVMPCFLDDELEHGHHRAMTELTMKAFHDAGKADVFPEHFKEGLKPWNIRKLYLPESEEYATLSLEIGELNEATGLTYPQLGEESRSFHRTQGMGVDLDPEPRTFYLKLAKSIQEMPDNNLFSGIPQDFKEYAQTVGAHSVLADDLIKLQDLLNNAIDVYPNEEQVLTQLVQASVLISELVKKTNHSQLNSVKKHDLVYRLTLKQKQVSEAAFATAKLSITNINMPVILNPGTIAKFDWKTKYAGSLPNVEIYSFLDTAKDWEISTSVRVHTKDSGGHTSINSTVHIPAEAELHNPYERPAISRIWQMHIGSAVFTKEEDLPIHVLPNLSLTFSKDHIAFNTNEPQIKPVTLKASIKNFSPKREHARLVIDLPKGWALYGNEEELAIEPFAKHELVLQIAPSSKNDTGKIELKAHLQTAEGKSGALSVQEISYDHIDPAYYVKDAKISASLFELEKPESLRIGYVDSGFDHVADHLAGVGFDVTSLTDTDLAENNLTVYDTIVIGTRAYLSRQDLIQQHSRLMDYVKHGGNLIMQYHKPTDGFNHWVPGPYPFKLGTPSLRWRVADESAKVSHLKPASPLFHYPNQIASEDWDGWIQERGLYFPMNWSSQYETVVQVADRDEQAMESGILAAHYGKGTFLYTNLIFHRQIEQQHPGAYKIFTNMLSYGRAMNRASRNQWIFKKSSKSLKTEKNVVVSSL